ncbi:hypothetical protein KAR91_65890 [Candidatus Pacearchaeota archaeon]|nr:hypothetical protein [Candidatus Pacearchaeota archaeon]
MKKQMYFCDICRADLSRNKGLGFHHFSDHKDAYTEYSTKMSEGKIHLCVYCIGVIKDCKIPKE